VRLCRIRAAAEWTSSSVSGPMLSRRSSPSKAMASRGVISIAAKASLLSSFQ
jgi:hypothetical protein